MQYCVIPLLCSVSVIGNIPFATRLPPPLSCIRQATFDTIVIADLDQHKPNLDFIANTAVERHRRAGVQLSQLHWCIGCWYY
jgi:hypothetical protein